MIQPVNFINEENVLGLKAGQYGCKVSGLFKNRTGRTFDIDIQFVCNDMGKGGFT